MTWALGRRRCGAVCALAVIALWGRECRCQIIYDASGRIVADCCTQCTSGLMYIQGNAVNTQYIQSVCHNKNGLYCDPARISSGFYAYPLSCELTLMCLPGSYCVNSINTVCPPGTYSSISAASSCTACSGGTSFQPSEGQTGCNTCSGCGAGQYRSVQCTPTANTVCSPCSSCPAGSYVEVACRSEYDTQCNPCTAGTSYSTSANSGACTRCSTCAVGKIKTGPCTTTHDVVCRDTLGSCCEQCRDGYFYNSGDFLEASNCPYFCGGGLCKAGSYAEIFTCKYCVSCVAGSYCVGDISTFCPAGTYSPVNSQSSCLACTEGTNYASGTGSRSCTAYTVCQPGSWVSQAPTTTSDRQCTACINDKTSTTTNALTCDVCRAGYFRKQTAFGAMCAICVCSGETYMQCPVGSNVPICNPCTGSASRGYCAAGNQPGVVCDGTQLQDTACGVCPEGKEKPSGAVQVCSFCPTGKYKAGANTNACVDCTNPPSTVDPKGVRYDAWKIGVTPSSNECPW